jgi:hypothetical protein
MTHSAFAFTPAATFPARQPHGTKTDLLRNAARAARGSVRGAIDRLGGARTSEGGAAMRSLARHCADYIRRTGLSPERFTVDQRGRIDITGNRPAVGARTAR